MPIQWIEAQENEVSYPLQTCEVTLDISDISQWTFNGAPGNI